MITVITTAQAQIYKFNPLAHGYAKNGVCFKAKGTTVNVEPVGDPRYFRIVEGKRKTSHYLRAEDVAAVAAV